MNRSFNSRRLITWIIILAIGFACLLLPENAGFTMQLKAFLTITVIAIFIFAFDLLNQTATALALIFSYAVFGFAESATVFAVFQQPVLWAVLGGLILAQILGRVGLLRRIALKCVILLKGSYKGLIYGLVFAGVAISFLMNNATIPMVIFAFGICKALNLKKSRESAAIMLAAAVPTNMIYMSMYSATYIMANTIGNAAGIESEGFTYVSYLTGNWPMLISIVIFALVLPRIMKPEEEHDWSVEVFKTQLDVMGKMSRDEIFGLIDCIIILAYMLIGSFTGLNIIWGLAAGPLLLYLPGVETGKAEDVDNCKWSVFVFAAASITIGNVASSLGFGNVIAQLAVPLVSGMNTPVFLGFTAVFAGLANFLMTPISLVTTFSVPFAQIGQNMGINPQAIYMALLMGSEILFLPYEGAMYYIIHAMGMTKMKDWIKVMVAKVLIEMACFMLLLIPYWYLVGVL
ncbi:MAG: SLC13 family permease [Lachnospiraceae bacterium]